MYYFTFRSITLAQRAAKALNQAGLQNWLLRTPKAMASGGCGYSVRIHSDAAAQAAALLRDSGFTYLGCYDWMDGRAPKEVSL